MNALRLPSLLALFALLADPLLAAESLDDILARHLAARGGREALAAVRSVRMVGTANAGPGRLAIVRREIARPGRIRTEIVFQGTTGVYTWDGAVGWQVSPLDGRLDAERMPPEEAAAAEELADIDGPLVEWKVKGHAVEVVGREALPGGPADRLKLTLRSGAVRDVWLDANSRQVVRTLASRNIRGQAVVLETVFADFRETAGVRFARSSETAVVGRPRRLRIVVDSVEVNPPLDPSRFSMPR